jgi:uncharacterized protein YqhQ
MLCGAKSQKIGGQALIEGVMMRSKTMVSWAVRRANSDITVEKKPFISASQRYRLLKLPVFRGAVSLYESLALGLKALSRSAELAALDESESEKPSAKDKIGMFLSMVLAFVIAFVVFLYLPMKILSFFVPEESAFLFNILAGAIRVIFFVAYLFLISLMKDIRRVFEYHGAEHKAICAHEAGMSLTVDNMKPYATFHPRCGTSFLLIVALICIFIFAVADAVIITFVGPYPSVFVRVLAHLAILPLVSGASYEVLRFSGNHYKVFPVSMLVAPGLWLQRITTREPDSEQMTVAIKALEAVL